MVLKIVLIIPFLASLIRFLNYHNNQLFILVNLNENLFLNNRAIMEVPINVADQYNHKSPTEPDNKAGARERAGFIDAPDIRAKK